MRARDGSVRLHEIFTASARFLTRVSHAEGVESRRIAVIEDEVPIAESVAARDLWATEGPR
jgi:hypothetical protein